MAVEKKIRLKDFCLDLLKLFIYILGNTVFIVNFLNRFKNINGDHAFSNLSKLLFLIADMQSIENFFLTLTW